MSVTGTNISLTLRQTKGSELTYAELDGNQSNLKAGVESHSHDEFAPALGANDNYVTDTEKTKLANLTGINTGDQDLSGYSTTSHNHNLNDLTEKSYNSLTDKPTIPSISGLLNESSHDLLDHAGLSGVLALGTSGTTACAGNDSRLSDSRPASDVYSWAKNATKPSYTYTKVGAASSAHDHTGTYQPLATVLTNTTASYTTALDIKLSGIATGAAVNVNADWNAVGGDAEILNKPATYAPSSHTTGSHSDWPAAAYHEAFDAQVSNDK